MQAKTSSWPKHAIVVVFCIFILLYAAFGLFDGQFYLPVRKGSLTLTGVAMVVPLIACALVSIAPLIRAGLLLVALQRSHAWVEPLLLWGGVATWLTSYWLAAY